MGYFDGIVDASFKTADDGNILFYPFGVLGKGYVVPNIEKKQEIRTNLKRFYFTLFPIIAISAFSVVSLVITQIIPWWIAGLAYLAIMAGFTWISYSVSKQLTKELTVVNNKLTIAESYQSSAKSHNIFTLLVLELASIGFVVIGYSMVTDQHTSWFFRISGIVSIVFFGLCGVAIGYMISVKVKK